MFSFVPFPQWRVVVFSVMSGVSYARVSTIGLLTTSQPRFGILVAQEAPRAGMHYGGFGSYGEWVDGLPKPVSESNGGAFTNTSLISVKTRFPIVFLVPFSSNPVVLCAMVIGSTSWVSGMESMGLQTNQYQLAWAENVTAVGFDFCTTYVPPSSGVNVPAFDFQYYAVLV